MARLINPASFGQLGGTRGSRGKRCPHSETPFYATSWLTRGPVCVPWVGYNDFCTREIVELSYTTCD